jgi:hypothetical protein
VAPAPEAAPAGSSDSGRYDRRLELPSAQAYFNDASKLPMAPIIVQPEPPRRSRSTLWIGGVLVLAAIFLWNRGRRLDLERREAAAAPTDPDGSDGPDGNDGSDDPPAYNAAPPAGTSASPATCDPTEEPR